MPRTCGRLTAMLAAQHAMNQEQQDMSSYPKI